MVGILAPRPRQWLGVMGQGRPGRSGHGSTVAVRHRGHHNCLGPRRRRPVQPRGRALHRRRPHVGHRKPGRGGHSSGGPDPGRVVPGHQRRRLADSGTDRIGREHRRRAALGLRAYLTGFARAGLFHVPRARVHAGLRAHRRLGHLRRGPDVVGRRNAGRPLRPGPTGPGPADRLGPESRRSPGDSRGLGRLARLL